MRYYSVVVLEKGFPRITFEGRNPYITSTYANAQDHLSLCQESWPDLEYKIVWFDV
jgi:hypothetical protein